MKNLFEKKRRKIGPVTYKKLLEKKRRKIGPVTYSFLIAIRAHHGKGFSLKTPPISPYLLFLLNERTVLNINLSVYELRRLFLVLKLRCGWRETIIMSVPLKKSERDGKLNKIAAGFYHFFDYWLGGTLTNFRFFFRFCRRLQEKLIASSLYLNKNSHRMIKREKELRGVLNVNKMPQVPSVFIGFGTAHWPLNEAVSLGLRTFLFIDADYKGQFANSLVPLGDSLMTIEKIMQIMVISIGEIKISEKFYWMSEFMSRKKAKFRWLVEHASRNFTYHLKVKTRKNFEYQKYHQKGIPLIRGKESFKFNFNKNKNKKKSGKDILSAGGFGHGKRGEKDIA